MFQWPPPTPWAPPDLLPQASHCKGPQDHLLIVREGGKMPFPQFCLTTYVYELI